MKVICVSNRLIGFTVGKWYDISGGDLMELDEFIDCCESGGFIDSKQLAAPGFIFVKGDDGIWSYLDKKYFRTVEEIREDKLMELGI